MERRKAKAVFMAFGTKGDVYPLAVCNLTASYYSNFYTSIFFFFVSLLNEMHEYINSYVIELKGVSVN